MNDKYRVQSLSIAWFPRVDGVFLTANPLNLVQQGFIANIPLISGMLTSGSLQLPLSLLIERLVHRELR